MKHYFLGLVLVVFKKRNPPQDVQMFYNVIPLQSGTPVEVFIKYSKNSTSYPNIVFEQSSYLDKNNRLRPLVTHQRTPPPSLEGSPYKVNSPFYCLMKTTTGAAMSSALTPMKIGIINTLFDESYNGGGVHLVWKPHRGVIWWADHGHIQ